MLPTVLKSLLTHREELSIGPFAEQLQPLIKESLDECNQSDCRKGTILFPEFLTWIVLACTVLRDRNYHKVIDFLIEPLRWLHLKFPKQIVTDGTVSHARCKLGISVFRKLFQKVVSRFLSLKADFHGMISVAFDGTIANMPDTKKNRKKFKKSSNQTKKGAFPLVRIMALMALSTRWVLDVEYAPYKGKKTGEHSLMMAILWRLQLENKNFLFQFDALFYSFLLVYQLQKNHQHFLIKLSPSIKLHPLEGRLPDGSYLAFVKGKIEVPELSTPKRKRYQKHKILVRVIEFKIRGFKPVRLITNILDSQISAKELVIQYHQRWEIEIGYLEIKTVQCATLKGQPPTIFRSKHPDLVQQELYATLIMYNMTRLMIYQAVKDSSQDPLFISFLDSLQWILEASPRMAAISKSIQRKRFRYLLELIAESTIDRPRRPRRNPRVIKQRNSSFPLKKDSDKEEKFDLDKELKIMGTESENENATNSENKVFKLDFFDKSQRKNKKRGFFKKVIDNIRLKAS